MTFTLYVRVSDCPGRTIGRTEKWTDKQILTYDTYEIYIYFYIN